MAHELDLEQSDSCVIPEHVIRRLVCHVIIQRLPESSMGELFEWLRSEYQDRCLTKTMTASLEAKSRIVPAKFLGRIEAPIPDAFEVE